MLGAVLSKAQQANVNQFAYVTFFNEDVFVISNENTFQLKRDGMKNPSVISIPKAFGREILHLVKNSSRFAGLRSFLPAAGMRNNNFPKDPMDKFLHKLDPLNEFSGGSILLHSLNPTIGSSIDYVGISSIFSLDDLNEKTNQNTPQVEEKTFSITPAIYYFLGGAAAAVIIYFLLPDRGSEAAKTSLTFGIPISPN
jgi:hypothetical protein